MRNHFENDEYSQDSKASYPTASLDVKDLGVSESNLINLLLRIIYNRSETTQEQLSNIVKLPYLTVNALIKKMQERRLLEVSGAVNQSSNSELMYKLSERGRVQAREAMEITEYTGPAPVSIESWRKQIELQKLDSEIINRQAIEKSLGNLVVNQDLLRKIGPAMNSGRAILLYGPAGNGKTSISERICGVYQSIVHIPYCLEVDGQVIKVFDPLVHRPVKLQIPTESRKLIRNDYDLRWVPCSRPVIVVGGEYTLEMMDVSYDDTAKQYEAPLHVKAIGGVFMIDDFGRQRVSATDLLNRWIMPMESRTESLKLKNGQSIKLPLDTLLIFSTNLKPDQLMDPAFLRRIPYKMLIDGPTDEQFHLIFRRVAEHLSIEIENELIDYIIDEVRNKFNGELANYMPKFILDQVISTCKYEFISPVLRKDIINIAIDNMLVS